ncbi:hypothetical protein AADZ90_004845 [Aestuariibius sp. 2305UL40-4]|uniref:hypothetical protein n=1 Tax=Aestuariibius violaceus TaxID=3234132 RepID=UPI00345E1B44
MTPTEDTPDRLVLTEGPGIAITGAVTALLAIPVIGIVDPTGTGEALHWAVPLGLGLGGYFAYHIYTTRLEFDTEQNWVSVTRKGPFVNASTELPLDTFRGARIEAQRRYERRRYVTRNRLVLMFDLGGTRREVPISAFMQKGAAPRFTAERINSWHRRRGGEMFEDPGDGPPRIALKLGDPIPVSTSDLDITAKYPVAR